MNVLSSNLPRTAEALEGAIEVLLTPIQPGCDHVDCLLKESNWLSHPWYEVANLAATALTNMPEGVNVGDTNYMISSLIIRVWFSDGVSYTKINRVVGVLMSLRTSHSPILAPFPEASVDVQGILRCVEHEFLRRVHDSYENDQITKSGDIFERRLGSRYFAPNQPLPYPNL